MRTIISAAIAAILITFTISHKCNAQTMSLNGVEVQITDIEQAYKCTPSLLRVGTLFLTKVTKEVEGDEGYQHNTAQFLYRGYGLSETLKQLAPRPLEESWQKTSNMNFDENMEYALDCVPIYNNWRELGAISEGTHKKALLKATYEIQSALVE